MNGPEHYREAEKCTDSAARASLADGEAAYYLGLAQVHATLALAAAVVTPPGHRPDALHKAWTEATS